MPEIWGIDAFSGMREAGISDFSGHLSMNMAETK